MTIDDEQGDPEPPAGARGAAAGPVVRAAGPDGRRRAAVGRSGVADRSGSVAVVRVVGVASAASLSAASSVRVGAARRPGSSSAASRRRPARRRRRRVRVGSVGAPAGSGSSPRAAASRLRSSSMKSSNRSRIGPRSLPAPPIRACASPSTARPEPGEDGLGELVRAHRRRHARARTGRRRGSRAGPATVGSGSSGGATRPRRIWSRPPSSRMRPDSAPLTAGPRRPSGGSGGGPAVRGDIAEADHARLRRSPTGPPATSRRVPRTGGHPGRTASGRRGARAARAGTTDRAAAVDRALAAG